MSSVIMFLNCVISHQRLLVGDYAFAGAFPRHQCQDALSPESMLKWMMFMKCSKQLCCFLVCIFLWFFSMSQESDKILLHLPSRSVCMVLLRFTSWSVELRERGGGAFPTPRNRVQVMWCKVYTWIWMGVHLLDPKYEEHAYSLQTQKIWKCTLVKGSDAAPIRPIQPVLICRIL